MELFFKISLFIEAKSIRKNTYKNNLISLLDETSFRKKIAISFRRLYSVNNSKIHAYPNIIFPLISLLSIRGRRGRNIGGNLIHLLDSTLLPTSETRNDPIKPRHAMQQNTRNTEPASFFSRVSIFVHTFDTFDTIDPWNVRYFLIVKPARGRSASTGVR